MTDGRSAGRQAQVQTVGSRQQARDCEDELASDIEVGREKGNRGKVATITNAAR